MTCGSSEPLVTAGDRCCPYSTVAARTQHGLRAAQPHPRVAERDPGNPVAGSEAAEFACWVRPIPRRLPALVARLREALQPAAKLGGVA